MPALRRTNRPIAGSGGAARQKSLAAVERETLNLDSDLREISVFRLLLV